MSPLRIGGTGSRGRAEAVTAHHLPDRGHIGRSSGGRPQDRADLLEVAWSEESRRHDGEERGVRAGAVLERVDGAARDEDRLTRTHLARLAVDRERDDAREPVIRLIEAVMAVGM